MELRGYHQVGMLTQSRPGADARTVALDFVRGNLDLLGPTAADLDGFEITYLC